MLITLFAITDNFIHILINANKSNYYAQCALQMLHNYVAYRNVVAWDVVVKENKIGRKYFLEIN